MSNITTTHIHAADSVEFRVDADGITIAEDEQEVSMDWNTWDALLLRIPASRAMLCPTQPAKKASK